jgi:hypothetical protein
LPFAQATGKKFAFRKTEQDVLKMAEAFSTAVLKSDGAMLDRLLADNALIR